MKKLSIFAAIGGAALLLSSCGANYSLISNHNLNSTQVLLASNNFKVIDTVSGSSEVFYILGIRDMNKKRLYDNAYSAMITKANLKDGARALTNTVTEEHVWGVPPFYFKRTITVSGNIIEFTK